MTWCVLREKSAVITLKHGYQYLCLCDVSQYVPVCSEAFLEIWLAYTIHILNPLSLTLAIVTICLIFLRCKNHFFAVLKIFSMYKLYAINRFRLKIEVIYDHFVMIECLRDVGQGWGRWQAADLLVLPAPEGHRSEGDKKYANNAQGRVWRAKGVLIAGYF